MKNRGSALPPDPTSRGGCAAGGRPRAAGEWRCAPGRRRCALDAQCQAARAGGDPIRRPVARAAAGLRPAQRRQARRSGQVGATRRAAREPRQVAARRPTGPTRSRCSMSRTGTACPSSCPSATGACSSRPSPSFVVRHFVMAADLSTTPVSGLTVQLCGDAHVSELRRVRLARAAAHLRRQRLRRDAAGAVGVGREASRGQPRDRRARAGVRVRRPPRCGHGHRSRVPRRHAPSRRAAHARGLVRAHEHR